VGWLVATVALGLISVAVGATGAGQGAVLGLVVGIGFIVSHLAVNLAFQGEGYALLWISGAYNAIGLVVAGIIVAVWT
jgi:Protein of unknown function (DUF1761)